MFDATKPFFFFQLNKSKTAVVLFGKPNARNLFLHDLGNLSSNIKPVARNSGELFVSDLILEEQVKRGVQFYFL